jgi:hypothetical protein
VEMLVSDIGLELIEGEWVFEELWVCLVGV